jgi:hypothetical protein
LGVSTADVLVVPGRVNVGRAGAGDGCVDGVGGDDLRKPSLGMIGGPPNWADAMDVDGRRAAAANRKA